MNIEFRCRRYQLPSYVPRRALNVADGIHRLERYVVAPSVAAQQKAKTSGGRRTAFVAVGGTIGAVGGPLGVAAGAALGGWLAGRKAGKINKNAKEGRIN